MATFKRHFNRCKHKIQTIMPDNYDILSENNQSTIVSCHEHPAMNKKKLEASAA